MRFVYAVRVRCTDFWRAVARSIFSRNLGRFGVTAMLEFVLAGNAAFFLAAQQGYDDFLGGLAY